MFSPYSQRGFTLIELVVCLVILGVVAGTAVVVTMDMRSNARRALLEREYGEIHAAAERYWARAVIAGCDMTSAPVNCTIDGVAGVLAYGYPTHGWWHNMASIYQSKAPVNFNTVSGVRFGYWNYCWNVYKMPAGPGQRYTVEQYYGSC